MKTRLLLLATLCIVQLLPAVAASGHTASALSARTVDPAAPAAGAILIKSPDGHLVFQLSPGNKDLLFTILSGNSPVISASPLRFSLDGTPLTENTQIAGVRRYQVREKYPWLGVHATAINECNGAELQMRGGGKAWSIDIRVFDNGTAFRIIVPGADSAARVPDEGTVFTLPGKAILWYHDINGHYEGVHEKKELQQVRAEEWVAPPATLKLPQGLYVAVTEAELQAYSGIVLQADGKSGLVLRMAHRQPPSHPYVLRYSPEDVARLSQPAVIRGTITTPWRVVMVGKDLNAMVNNDILQDLCPPPDPTLFPQGIHTDWIRPGRAVWKYLDGGGDGTPETMKKFTDEAAALGFEYNILEGFWTKWTDAQLKDLVDYSRQKGVGIWIWQHSKSLRDPATRTTFFQHCHDLGITGIKIDFFDHEAKEVIDLYQAILKETAALHLLVDFHGSNKPTGLSRTWPNEMTREAVKGMEASKLADRATHETTIPFTRLLAGPAEYTVMLFGDRRRNTSWTHQIASAVILGGEPMLTYAANPETILSNPAVDLIKKIPAQWDETVVLPGSEIGEMAAYARRKGNDWFVAVMNGNAPKKIKISLSFLKRGSPATVRATIIKDAPGDPASLQKAEATFTAADTIELDLEAGGGYLALIKN